ncbi:putative lipid II flippase FtsW [Mycetocola miduiensis]|uniref:Probable peptidoglycan glycosyltransferase FtsW n=1 Tax=Mycetocola miduiensis TaxID=995034 RepID=A0A1I5A8L2_9MICO|nr:putative lipid II flippase FtsW [Mycetocola miduiensis]SFN58812.1 cell division-specific peptidoglycan biosynthesis regulator FtsW [Mycetocola miduiensis]
MSAPTTSRPSSAGTPVSSARILLGRTLTPQSRNYLLVLGTTLFLVGVGLVMVLSSSSVDSFLDNKGFFGGFWKQATYAVMGIPLMLVISSIPVSFWKRWAWFVLAAGLVLQMLVFTPLGIAEGGNRNWIALGPISGQPSELLKLALAIWLGAVLGRKTDLLSNWKHALIPVAPVAAIALGLVLAGQDLGTVVIMAGLVIGALFFANVKLRYLAVPIAAGVALFLVMAIISPNRMARIMTFLDDECLDYENLCWQPLHGTWALANGGVFGLGLGNSREKYSWLPAASNDYIFAIIGEELGLIGAVVVLVMFVLLAVGFVRIIRSSSDPFVRITTGAIMVWIIGQAFVNIGVVLRLLPVLGVPLPFISAGGTALLTSLAAIGIVLAFAREQASPARPAPEGRFRS